MTEATANEPDERVLGRRWTVRLDPVGRGSTAVRVSCSRPSCAEQRLPSAAAGRAAAVEHLKAHLRSVPRPRAEAYCACRADSCHTHLRPEERQERGRPWRCGGAVVLAVVTDREGRWWRAMECCSRCVAATPGARTVSSAAPADAPPAGTASASAPSGSSPSAAPPGAVDRPPVVSPVGAPQFSSAALPPGATGAQQVPGPRTRPVRRRHPYGRIAQRDIPYDLRPTALRDELGALGDRFRTYQQRPEPDLAILADLQERKARAFTAWAEVTGDPTLRSEAERAEQAAATARLQHQQRTGESADGSGPTVARLLTAPAQWEQARAVLAHVAGHDPLPDPEARLLAVMVTLRAALTGVGNLVGQDVAALGLTDARGLIERLTGCGWLVVPGTADDLLASRPENPTPITVPSLVPPEDGPGPLVFGKKLRPRLSGWAQRIVTDKKLRKAKAGAATRLLALTLATRVGPDGRLGAGGEGVELEALVAWCGPLGPEGLRGLVDELIAAQWIDEATLTDTRLTGRLHERALPLTCPLP
ncbi:hypothetical protein [Streptomyces sp. NPDC048606]|uniref:hypothetical protein n=1 Tax=Streptomyces sp. NPDC048606 TaxID=3154726 RepID=UPI00341A3CEC